MPTPAAAAIGGLGGVTRRAPAAAPDEEDTLVEKVFVRGFEGRVVDVAVFVVVGGYAGSGRGARRDCCCCAC